MNGEFILFVVLLSLVVGSAMGVSVNKHTARALVIERRQIDRAINDLEADWGRLQLEYGTWAAQALVESAARKKLDMYVPEFSSIRVLQP